MRAISVVLFISTEAAIDTRVGKVMRSEMMDRAIRSCFVLALMLALFGCATTPDDSGKSGIEWSEPSVEVEVEAGEEQQEPAAPEQPVAEEVPSMRVFADINFDFDRADLKTRARNILNSLAFALFEYPELELLIEGHCDERGSNEYNLALGERRARAARDYLIEMGIEPHRITMISYGEEAPLDPRHNEDAWSRNRRDHFVLKPQ